MRPAAQRRYTPPANRQARPRGLAELQAADRAIGSRYCLACGCTDAYACPGGCAWAGPADLCTSCAHRLAPGVYDLHQRGELFLELGEMLEGAGYADTPENRETLHAEARRRFGLAGVPVVDSIDGPA